MLVASAMMFWVPVLALAGTLAPAPRVHFLMRLAGWVVLRTAGIRLRVRGLENLPSSGGYLLISNHINMFDPMIMYKVVPRHLIAIEKATHFRWPFYGRMIRQWGNLPVMSSQAVQSRETLKHAADLLRGGTAIFVYPEGTRARSGRLGAFKKGSFHLALDARVPVIPVVMKGAGNIFLEGSWSVQPGTEEIAFLARFPLDGYGPEDAGRLAADVRALIAAEVGET